MASASPAAVEDIAGAAMRQCARLDRAARRVVGASLGGMSVTAFATQFPQAAADWSRSRQPAARRCDRLRSVQREAIMRDPDWRAAITPRPPPRNGMRIARKLGTITIARLPSCASDSAGAARRQCERAQPVRAALCHRGYLEAQAERFVHVFDPLYLYLSSAMDRFDLAEHGGSFTAALRAVRTRRCW